MVANNGTAIIPILLYLVCCSTCVLTNKLFTELYVEVLCEGNARRRMRIKSWKEDSRGTTFLARGDRKVKVPFCEIMMFFQLVRFSTREVVSNFYFLL